MKYLLRLKKSVEFAAKCGIIKIRIKDVFKYYFFILALALFDCTKGKLCDLRGGNNLKGVDRMKITMTGKQIELTDGLKQRIEDRFSKLDKYFYKDTEAFVTLSVQKENQVVETTIHSGGLLLRVEEATTDMYTSIDNAVDILERQLRRNKTKIEKKMKKEYVENVAFDQIADSSEEEQDIKIVRTKKIESKPMSPEEAVLQMNLLGHEFFMFLNEENGAVSVVYKRKEDLYGVIEAET